jgi:hypothetical protein
LDTREKTALSRYYESSSIRQAFFKWLKGFIKIATFAADNIYKGRGEKGSWNQKHASPAEIQNY